MMSFCVNNESKIFTLVMISIYAKRILKSFYFEGVRQQRNILNILMKAENFTNKKSKVNFFETSFKLYGKILRRIFI